MLGGGGSRGRPVHPHPCDFKASAAERSNYALASLVGHMVVAQTADGTEYEGVLHSGWWKEDGPKGIILEQARPVLGPNLLAQKPVEAKMIPLEELMRFEALNVDIYDDEINEAARRKGGEVNADSEIDVAGGRTEFGVERDLVAASDWLASDTALGGLDSSGGVTRNWDQFAVNERLGGRSTYSDELYTTKISDKKFSAEQLRKAERLAKEIEGKVSENVHVAEERGQRELAEAMDGDMDEEDKYSMVLGGRTGASGENKDVTATPLPPTTEEGATAAAPPAAAPAAAAPAAAPAAASTGTKLRATAKEFVPGGGGGFTPASPAPPAGGGHMGVSPMGYGAQMGGHYGGHPMGGMQPGRFMPQPGMMGAGMSPQQQQMAMQMQGMSPQQQQQMAMQMQQQQQMAMQGMSPQQQQQAQQQMQMQRMPMGGSQSPMQAGMMQGQPGMMQGQPGYGMQVPGAMMHGAPMQPGGQMSAQRNAQQMGPRPGVQGMPQGPPASG